MNKLFLVSAFTLTLIGSFVFGIIIAVMVYAELVDIQFAIGLTIVINVLMWLIGPWITDLMNKWFYHTTFLSKDELKARFPDVYEIIEKITTEKKFRFPKVGIIADDNPTAFSYGSARYNARVVLTQGIFKFLNPQEVQAVVAHEMGHIVNRDFVVMMIASTLVQILYEIYAVLIRTKGKSANVLRIVAIAAYILYWISTYLVFYLGRTREKLADEFSARRTSPQDLSNALIKIAYGIVMASDDDATARLLHSTRQLGIVDVKNAKHVGVTSYITHNDPHVLSEVMVFDQVSWWAKWTELNSTHPLTGKRIKHMSELSKEIGKPFSYDIEAAIARMKIDYNRLSTDFLTGMAISILPGLAIFAFLFFTNIFLLPIGICLAFIIMALYKFPQGKAVETTILDQMRDPYASPMRGKPVLLKGKVVGRGVAGYVLSEDMMFQDKTGLTFLDFNSVFGFLGDFFFALGKIKKLFDKEATAEGWYFRGMGSMVSLRYIKTDTEFVRSHPILWSIMFPIMLLVFAALFFYVVYY